MKKAILLLAEGFEEVEALTPVDLLRRSGIHVTTVSVTEDLLVTGSHNISIMADTLLENTKTTDVDMIILPGGMPGTLNLGEHNGVTDIISEFADKGKWVAAICAAPGILGELGMLRGKSAVCYPGHEEKLKDADIRTEEVIKDGIFITSRGLGTAIPFALALIETLLDKKIAGQIAESIIYRTGECNEDI